MTGATPLGTLETHLEALFSALSPDRKERFVSRLLAVYGGDWGRTAAPAPVDRSLLATRPQAAFAQV